MSSPLRLTYPSHSHGIDRVISFALETPWALTRPMCKIVATVLARRLAGVPAADDPSFVRQSAAAPEPLAAEGTSGVMVIPIHGVIAPRMNLFSDISGGASFEETSKHIERAASDPKVSTIVLDIDSPGGSVAGATECAQVILRARERKRVIASVNFGACSAAYWLAAMAHEIVSAPSGLAGSIGVYLLHEDFSAALDTLGIKWTFISAGEFKVDGNEGEPLSDTARARMQKTVDHYYGLFVTDVATGRGTSAGAVRDGYAKGSAVPASEALALGMIDRIETLDATVSRALTPASSLNPAALAARISTRNHAERALLALSF